MAQPPSSTLDAIFDRSEGPVAVLRFSDGQLLRVPAAALAGAKPGDTIRLAMQRPAGEADPAAQARAVLNELLSER